MPLGKIARNGHAAAVGTALAVLCEMAVLCLCCAPSMAQAPESSFAASAGKPIEIRADVVERDDQKRTAVFRGNALATLSGIELKSQEIHVTYNAVVDETAGNDAASMPSLNEVRRDITQIDARGDVLVTILRRYQVKSDVATIDVKKQQLTIGGEVVLSQGEHLIRGKELIFDFVTGLFKFRNGLGNPASHHRRSALPPPGLQK